MKKLTILCDADDTIINLLPRWLAEINRMYGRTVRKEDVHDWDITKSYPGLTANEVLKPLYQEGFWNTVTPVKGSGYYLERLIKDGHNVWIVTASNLETSGAKTARLLKLFPFLRQEQILFTQNKQAMPGDVLIDDGVHNLIGGSYHKILFHQPGNAAFREGKHGITRVYSWEEAYKRVKDFAA